MLRDYLTANILRSPNLSAVLQERIGTADLEALEQNNFSAFFKLAVPKAIASILDEQDWYVDDELGIKIFEFARESNKGPYKMLHMAMHVKRKQPPQELRAPGQPSGIAVQAYNAVAPTSPRN